MATTLPSQRRAFRQICEENLRRSLITRRRFEVQAEQAARVAAREAKVQNRRWMAAVRFEKMRSVGHIWQRIGFMGRLLFLAGMLFGPMILGLLSKLQ